MRKPRKPKMAKYPKLPRSGASLQVMQNYQRRCAEVDRKNAQKVSAYNKKISDIAKAKTLRQSLAAKKSRGAKVHRLKVA